jgi:pimeloyl-ACP methyl ester carboxylesterase
MNNLNRTITLKDSRTVGYAEAGDPQGKLLFLCHGLHSSRLEVKMFHDEMLEAGIRVISVDRAGMGISTFQENRQVLDIVDDIEALADSLGIENFSVLGSSSGAKYALACAFKIPERLDACYLVSSAVSVEFMNDDMPKSMHFFASLLQKAPWLLKPMFWFFYGRFTKDYANADKFLGNIAFPLKEVDKELLQNETIKKEFWEIFSESYRQGTKAVAYDAKFDMLKNSWGFSVEDIQMKNIHFFHGELDGGVPVSMARAFSEKIKGATFRAFEGEGHLSIFFNKLGEIIEKISTPTPSK